MPSYRLMHAYLPAGWGREVLVEVSDAGYITAMHADAGADAEAGAAAIAASSSPVVRIDGIVIPGMPNAHSHAFQRAMVGSAEYRRSAQDSFWTWREAMYALATRIEPEDLSNIAAQLYVEMLKAGYTSVAEFHYLHRRPDDSAYATHNELWQAVAAAARVSGIALTFLPTLYQTSDFGGQSLRPQQGRFWMDTESFLRSVESLSRACNLADSTRCGAAFHSLRAVPLDIIKETAAALRAIDADMPIHIHVAEQMIEVDACVRATGRRPVELLVDSGLLDERWCLVHATHANAAELRDIAASRAAVCVAISTEANLGDGAFDAQLFAELGGRLCIGSDSQATVDPAEELRWLEYQQRLKKNRRGVLAAAEEPHVGTVLWRSAAEQGGQAIGQPAGRLAVGQRADWLVLDPAHPALLGGAMDTMLDRLLFAGGTAAIRDVMVAGSWVIKDRHHGQEVAISARFGESMSKMGKMAGGAGGRRGA